MKCGRVRDEETGKLVDDPATIVYNPKVTISGIPAEADDYMLARAPPSGGSSPGGRSSPPRPRGSSTTGATRSGTRSTSST